MMDKKEAREILIRFRLGTATEAEEALVREWLMFGEFGELEIADMEMEQDLMEIAARLPLETSKKVILVPLWKKLSVAASIAIAAMAGGYFYYANKSVNIKSEFVNTNDIAPGKDGATLTLASGRKILINDALAGKVAEEEGVRISKNAAGQLVYEVLENNSKILTYNTLTTTRGQQSQVRLPDGTLVFLNAASSLRYPASFGNLKERKVELSGEGYFEVFKDKAHPFIVKTTEQEIEVLGTQFNVNVYPDEPVIKTTLLEGSIKLSTDFQSEILKPSEQAMLRDNRLKIREVETEEIVAWKNNEFLFRDDDFRTNMRKIARWYDVEIIYEADAPDNFKLGGFLSRTKNLSAILKLMEKTDKVHFKISGKKVYVSK